MMRPCFGGVLEHAPGIGAVAAPLVLELGDGFEERVAVLRPDAVFDRHQHRPAIMRDLLRGDRRRPVHRRRQIDAHAGLQFPAPGQRDGGDRAGGGEKMRHRQPGHDRDLAPHRAAERQAAEEHRGVEREPARRAPNPAAPPARKR